jgi:hypothetical protein
MNPRLFFNRLIGQLMRIGTPLSILLIALTLSQSSNAQALYGAIAGNVKDISNAVVPGAAVKITHKGTDQTLETAASSDGSFNFPALQTGTYEITVRKPGFKAYTRRGVEVTLNNITRSDITLEIGSVSETVSVTTSAPTSGAPRVPEVFDSGFANSAQQGGDSAFQFFSQEMSFDNRLVKGAPFSADIVSETIQTLPDGNRIVQRSEGRVYRDSHGRTRSERTYQIGGSSEQRHVININDPAASVSYSLDPETRIARMNSRYIGLSASPSDMFLTPPFNPDAPSHQPRGVPVGVPGGVEGWRRRRGHDKSAAGLSVNREAGERFRHGSGVDSHRRERAGGRGESHQRPSGAPFGGGRCGQEVGLQTGRGRRQASSSSEHY